MRIDLAAARIAFTCSATFARRREMPDVASPSSPRAQSVRAIAETKQDGLRDGFDRPQAAAATTPSSAGAALAAWSARPAQAHAHSKSTKFRPCCHSSSSNPTRRHSCLPRHRIRSIRNMPNRTPAQQAPTSGRSPRGRLRELRPSRAACMLYCDRTAETCQ